MRLTSTQGADTNEHKFASSVDLSGAAKAGEGCQFFNALDYHPSGIPGCGGIVLLYVSNRSFKLAGCFGCPPNDPHE
jgi:hypothetical protein